MKKKDELVITRRDSQGRPVSYEYFEEPDETTAIVPHEPQMIDVPPVVSPMTVAQPVRTITKVQGSHVDRARAFGMKTLQLSLITGGLFATAVWFLTSAHILVLGIVYFVGFALTWLVAYVIDALASAEGVELYSAHRLWNFLDREQKERHRRYGVPKQKRWGWVDTVLLLIIVTLLVVGLISELGG